MSGVILTACGASGAINNLNNSLNNSLNMENSDDDDSDDKVSGDVPEPTPTITDRVVSFSVTGTYSTNGTENNDGDDIIRATYSKTEDTTALVRRADNFILTVNDVEHVINGATFSNFNGDLIRYEGSGGVRILVATNNNLAGILDGTHPTVQGTFIDYTTDPNDYTVGGPNYNFNHTLGYITIGRQTSAEVVANQSAIATYNGRMVLDTGLAETTSGAGATYLSDISMEVNFTANTVSGAGTFPLIGDSSQSGAVNFMSAPIIGNGFAGSFTFDSAFYGDIGVTNSPTGQYVGNFFGENAEDLAGVMQLDGISANGAIIGVGGFRADRQDSQ